MLVQFGIGEVLHYAPLHYLPFIARSGALLSKVELRKQGFGSSHFRATSKRQDEERGFAEYVHLTLDAYPPILRAKLSGGFPHFEISLPADAFRQRDYLLCRFNIAKARYFRGAKQEPAEGKANGRYYGCMRLPVAMSAEERADLLRANLGKQMIEVLIRGRMPLVDGAKLKVFDDNDADIARTVVARLGSPLVVERDASMTYRPSLSHRKAVGKALERAMADAAWRDTELDFDRV